LAQSNEKGWFRAEGRWVAGDFHHHTTFTDGKNPIATVNYWANEFGLQWWANSEHGGGFTTDGYGPVLLTGFDTGAYARFWDNLLVYPAGTIIGDAVFSGSHRVMWRWQSLRDFEFGDTLQARMAYPDRTVIQSFEWNVPGHEHCSLGLIAGQFDASPDCAPLAEFEYRFDASDADISGGLLQGWTSKNTTNNHAKALEAAAWLQANYPNTSWLVPAHVERKSKYKVQDFRDLNNAAPTVAFGFESVPGHQKEANRGSYSLGGPTVGGSTYGGAGVYSAKVGGLWDALLGEGRRWWLFASSDFHETPNDFFPGEYQKTYTFIPTEDSSGTIAAPDIVNGLRSGISFVVMGDLINVLDFQAKYKAISATMGQELQVDRGGQVTIKIRFKSPEINNHGDHVQVHHVDLIGGMVRGLVDPGSPDYSKDTNETTQVLARFNTVGMPRDEDGWYTFVYHVRNLDQSMYFRLRGTNLPPGTTGETDMDGNPLPDIPGQNTAEAVWKDLWFYSNPIFVKVK
jgi:hypothetical protein